MASMAERIDRLRANVESVIVGKSEVIDLALVALFGRGHLLIEDVPGVGKTTLARALARSLRCSFQRIQCTPDLLPSDILGINLYNQRTGAFEFKPGPIFANIVLADEINRATPRTQSSLLEAMGEFQVTIDRESRALPEPFMVIATQNHVEYEGTFPLPESQLDRFALSIRVGYLSLDDERKVVLAQRLTHPIDELQPVLSREELLEIQEAVKHVRVDPAILDYILHIVAATRESTLVKLGASPRGSLVLYRSAQAVALIHHRDYVIPDDVKEVALPTLAHRIIVKPAARFSGKSGADVVQEALDRVPVPL
jgi:MoxR-like ATPase